jgi:thiol-disulfide isomerase/thioredoxin
MNGTKCVIGKEEEENRGEITVFTAAWCGACKRRVPHILKKAQAAGLSVKLIDVDDADPSYGKTLRRVKFVPHIDYMGHEIEEDEIDLIAEHKED